MRAWHALGRVAAAVRALDILWGHPARGALAQDDGRASRRARRQQVADLVLVDLDVAHLRAWHTALTQLAGAHATSHAPSFCPGTDAVAGPLCRQACCIKQPLAGTAAWLMSFKCKAP